MHACLYVYVYMLTTIPLARNNTLFHAWCDIHTIFNDMLSLIAYYMVSCVMV